VKDERLKDRGGLNEVRMRTMRFGVRGGEPSCGEALVAMSDLEEERLFLGLWRCRASVRAVSARTIDWKNDV
jgi:hypothetical protein